MNKYFVKAISLLALFFFSVSLLLPQPGFAEKACWNDGSITYGEGGASGATEGKLGNINQKGRTEVADPVDVSNGNYAYQHQDLSIPARGLSLEFVRFYNSLDAYDGPFGIGWSHSYNIFLLEVSNGSETFVLRRNANGSKDKFLENPDGSYTNPSGCYDTLIKEANGYSIRTKHGFIQRFDSAGRLISIIDRNQNTLTLEYDPTAGFLTEVSDSLNRFIEFKYSANKVSKIIDFTGRTINYNYDTNKFYVTIPPTQDYPSGLTTTYTYNDQKRLVSIADPKGQVYVSMTHDENARVKELNYGEGIYRFTYQANLTTVIDPKGFTSEYKLNPNGTVVSEKRFTNRVRANEPSYYQTSYEYNDNRERTKVIYPKGNWTKYTYDALGNILEIRQKKIAAADIDDSLNDIVTAYTYEPWFNFTKTSKDPKGNLTTYIYDYELNESMKGNLRKIVYPKVDNQTIESTFAYNSYGQIETATDPNQNVTKYDYFPNSGYLKSLIRGFNTADVSVTELTYDALGNVRTIKDSNGNMTTFNKYDINNKLKEMINAKSQVTKYTYDLNGNLAKEERQSNQEGSTFQVTSYTYTALDQLETITDHAGNVTTFQYDLNGNRTKVIDAERNVTTRLYDERDLLYTVTDAENHVTTYGYDLNGNLETIKDANQNATTYTYDDFDRLRDVIYPNTTSIETYTYDKASNLTELRNPTSEVIKYTYDELNRLTFKEYIGCSASRCGGDVDYIYDAGSRLKSISNSLVAIEYPTYDSLDRIKQIDTTIHDTQFTIRYGYDKTGNRESLEYPNSRIVKYDYDELNRLDKIKNVSDQVLYDFNYDTLSRRQSFSRPNGITTSYDYDSIDRLIEIKGISSQGTVPQITVQYPLYDKVGNRKQMTDSRGTETYGYDRIYQLKEVASNQTPGTSQYNYDSVGNRTNLSAPNTPSNYTPNNLNQYSAVDGVAYTYDKTGNLTNDGVNTYTYDYENRLVSVERSAYSVQYQYDPFGRRLTKHDSQSTNTYLYDGDDILEVYPCNLTLTTCSLQQSFLYGPNIDEPLEVTSHQTPDTSYYYHADGLGSIIALTDFSGNVVETYQYDAYGIPETRNSSGTVIPKSQVQNPQFLFTAREYDSESSLYFYRSRYYSPKLGRFLGRDTVDGDDKNRFTYVENNPINFIDPWGELSIPPPIGAPSPPRGGGGIDYPFPGPTLGGKSKDRAPSGLGIDGNYVADEAKDKAKGEEENKGKEQPKNPKPKGQEKTPITNPEDYENVHGGRGKKNKKTGEIWVRDRLHGDEWEVYKKLKDMEKGQRDRSVWDDGRVKKYF